MSAAPALLIRGTAKKAMLFGSLRAARTASGYFKRWAFKGDV
jgi:hypothetical protein